MEDNHFTRLVRDYYLNNGRVFAWRSEITPYRIHVSELMLQQTQTTRVVPAFDSFIRRFPDYQDLVDADLPEVLQAWQGLGYNRRARFLKLAAEAITHDHQGILPGDETRLRLLPGIGQNTAASILAFAFNLPTVFVETNIRTVFLHHYFPGQTASDREILPLVARTLDRERPREWYWALMDYGVFLKKTIGNVSRRSSHYTMQSKFAGSVRQVRGEILRVLLDCRETGTKPNTENLAAQVAQRLSDVPTTTMDYDARFQRALAGLLKDGLVAELAQGYGLAD